MPYAEMNRPKNDVMTARNTHRPTRAGATGDAGRSVLVVGQALLLLPGLRGQLAGEKPPADDAYRDQREQDRDAHAWIPWSRPAGIDGSSGSFCGMKSALAPGTL